MKAKRLRVLLAWLLILTFILPAILPLNAQPIQVHPQTGSIALQTPDGTLSMSIAYKKGCFVQTLIVNNTPVALEKGIFTGLQTEDTQDLSSASLNRPTIRSTDTTVVISGIQLANKTNHLSSGVHENWTFTVRKDKILWKIDRFYPDKLIAQSVFFPQWNFKDLTFWKAGIISNGGVVWIKYLKNPQDTYGVHAGGTIFWNGASGSSLSIQPVAKHFYPAAASDTQNHSQTSAAVTSMAIAPAIATSYSHSAQNGLTVTSYVSPLPLQQHYGLDRFVGGKSDVFAPFEMGPGKLSVTYELRSGNYFKQYNRGELTIIDATAVRDLLNTTARYGVVDDSIVGANGWLTNWKCLHEPFFGQLAMVINDSNYTKNLEASLDREMRLAIQPDGRVLSRWHNEPGDEMPGTYNAKTGYYEAKWGYTIDAQTSYVLNVADLFNLTGNIQWLQRHRATCQKALQWLINRDENHNDIFEMKNKNIADMTSSDWLDIVWASYENAFVNAQMYAALNSWADCEAVMLHPKDAVRYRQLAQKLKTAFNRPVNEGGFWLPEKKQYVYWRDQDGSIHGENLVTPVQFAAIGYGLCTDPQRKAQILQQIESRMEKEQLFHWPLCFDSFKQQEVSSGNWPFPTYENGDIFLTWGYLGVKSYADYNKKLAVDYIQKLLAQYKKDGLSFQRYGRKLQNGLGSDILAGNATSIIGLYVDIYGLKPKWNRLVLDPHLTKQLTGTKFSYHLRGELYDISYPAANKYTVKTATGQVISNQPFGIASKKATLVCYLGDQDRSYVVLPEKSALELYHWDQDQINLKIHIPKGDHLQFEGLLQGRYQIIINGQLAAVAAVQNGGLKVRVPGLGTYRVLVKKVP